MQALKQKLQPNETFISLKHDISNLEDLFVDLGQKAMNPVNIGNFRSNEFQIALTDFQKHCFYPEEFGIFSVENLSEDAQCLIDYHVLRRLNSAFIQGVILSGKYVRCTKSTAQYKKLFGRIIMLARKDKFPRGTLGEIGMLMNSGYTASLATRLEFFAADAELALKDSGFKEGLQTKVEQIRNSTVCKWRVVFSRSIPKVEIATDFLSEKKLLKKIIGTKVERLARLHNKVLIRIGNL